MLAGNWFAETAEAERGAPQSAATLGGYSANMQLTAFTWRSVRAPPSPRPLSQTLPGVRPPRRCGEPLPSRTAIYASKAHQQIYFTHDHSSDSRLHGFTADNALTAASFVPKFDLNRPGVDPFPEILGYLPK